MTQGHTRPTADRAHSADGHGRVHPHGVSGHDHHHGTGGHHHGHAHRGGILGWLQHTFAHSHDTHEMVDDAMESSAIGVRVTTWALVSLALTTVIQAVIVWFSGSTALFADTVHNLGDGANSIPLIIAFLLQRRARSRQFTYGFGRTEDLAGLVIVLTIAISAVVAGWESVQKLIHPQPITHLPWVTAAALVGFLGNEAVALFQIRAGRRIGSAALVADGLHARIDGITSLAVLIAVAGTVLGMPIVDPIIGLLITVTILVILKSASTAIFRRMLDGIEPAILAEVEHVPLHVDGIHAVEDARARWIGHKVHADLTVVVNDRLTVDEAAKIADRVKAALADHVPAFGDAMIALVPLGSGAERGGDAALATHPAFSDG